MPLTAWAAGALLVGALQIVVGSAALWAGGGSRDVGGIPDSILVLIALVNLGVALLLLVGGRRDVRAVFLGGAFICGGSAFSLGPLMHSAEAFPALRSGILALGSLQVEALNPYFIWRFAALFPQVTRYGRDLQYTRVMTRTSLVAGLVLMGAAIVRVPLLDRSGPVYWPLLLLLIVAALVASLSKLWRAKVEERRRVTWLFVGLGLGVAPVVLVNALAWLVPAFASWVRRPGALQVVAFLSYPAILLAPFVIAYSVLVEHALDVRLVVRKAIQYALVRYSLATLVAVPFGVLALYLIANRDRTLSEVFAGPGAILLGITLLLGVVALTGRRRIARWVDRVFFREQYDARQVLSGLAKASQQARDGSALGDLLVKEVSRALHPRAACLLLRDPRARAFIAASGAARPLQADASLVHQLAERGKSFSIDWEQSRHPVHSLPAVETEWLGDAGFRLLVPILSTTGGVAGILGLTEKLSELPYSKEDQALLEDIATSAGLTIENQALRSGIGLGDAPLQEYAVECQSCGAVAAAAATRCPECSQSVVPSPVPLVLAGKYEFQRRVGRGGMGVVYRARDLGLDREVAIKTLPWLSPRHAQRLRREARAMASLSHPNLALVHAVESWHGTPLLVLEFLPGGTLTDLLTRRRLSLAEAVELGVVLAGVAGYIHDRGILHRDIKPSNIGYTATGQPKLLDFGVAHLLASAHPPDPGPNAVPPAFPAAERESGSENLSTTITVAGEVVGTLLYLPPEALERVTPGPGFDLWSISMVLYEAIVGRNPLAEDDVPGTLRRLATCDIPDIRRFVPELPAPAAAFFQEALAREPRRRPATATELRGRLASLLMS